MMMTSANQPALAPAPPASAPSPPTAASNHVVIKAEPPADMSGLNTFSDAVSQLLRASRIHQQQQQDHHHQQQQQVNPKAAEGEQEEAEEDDGGESDEGSDAVEVRFISFSSSSSRERFLNQPTRPPRPKKKKKINTDPVRQRVLAKPQTCILQLVGGYGFARWRGGHCSSVRHSHRQHDHLDCWRCRTRQKPSSLPLSRKKMHFVFGKVQVMISFPARTAQDRLGGWSISSATSALTPASVLSPASSLAVPSASHVTTTCSR